MSNNNDCQNIKISYFIEEIENQDKEEINIEELMAEMENTELNDELTIPKMINYNENYTVKELLLICDYYGFAKELKNNKYNKEEIINVLVHFENEPLNNNIFMRRQSMWYYINELKKDKFMKKYVLW